MVYIQFREGSFSSVTQTPNKYEMLKGNFDQCTHANELDIDNGTKSTTVQANLSPELQRKRQALKNARGENY